MTKKLCLIWITCRHVQKMSFFQTFTLSMEIVKMEFFLPEKYGKANRPDSYLLTDLEHLRAVHRMLIMSF